MIQPFICVYMSIYVVRVETQPVIPRQYCLPLHGSQCHLGYRGLMLLSGQVTGESGGWQVGVL